MSRFTYNWALSNWKELYAKGEKPNEESIRKKLNRIKANELPWMLEVSKSASQQAIKDLGQAFSRFFKKLEGYPKFKKKDRQDSFRIDNGPTIVGADAIQIIDNKIKVPKLDWVKMTEKLRFKGQIKSVVISKKAALRLARLHLDIANIRRDYLHKATTNIVLSYDKIGIENFNVKGMSSNRRLARHILDQSFYELQRQLEYKADWYGSKITVAPRFYPSSKLCHVCNWKNAKLNLKTRSWTCDECNTCHDRDYNAAKNLELLCTVSSTETNACRVGSSSLS